MPFTRTGTRGSGCSTRGSVQRAEIRGQGSEVRGQRSGDAETSRGTPSREAGQGELLFRIANGEFRIGRSGDGTKMIKRGRGTEERFDSTAVRQFGGTRKRGGLRARGVWKCKGTGGGRPAGSGPRPSGSCKAVHAGAYPGNRAGRPGVCLQLQGPREALVRGGGTLSGKRHGHAGRARRPGPPGGPFRIYRDSLLQSVVPRHIRMGDRMGDVGSKTRCGLPV